MFIHTENIYNTRAAEEIAPFLNELFRPQSVVDIGCGRGTWLSIFSKYPNVKKLVGIDGLYVDRKSLVIPEEFFYPIDLKKSFELKEHFDLVLCLEVAEHLPEESSDVIVESLIKHGDSIVFSAAIPEQGGVGHVNEQWPEYWRKKFLKHGFYPYDILRKKFWDNEKVEWWYRQNMFVYVKQGSSKMDFAKREDHLLSLIHPELFNKKLKEAKERESRLINTINNPGIGKSFKDLLNSSKSKIHGWSKKFST